MKKILILLILTFLLSGCSLYNLGNFTLPDDTDFLALIQELDTPEKICQYMKDNFTYKENIFYNPDPYTLWQTKKGDCNDFATFGTFVANYHNYDTWQIKIFYDDTLYSHVIAIFKENNKYNLSDNQYYFFIEAISFKEIVKYDYFLHSDKIWIKYTVYDYDMNIVEQKINSLDFL